MIPDKETRDIQAYLNDTLPQIRRDKFELRLQNEPEFKARFEELKPILETIEDIQYENRIREIVEEIKKNESDGNLIPSVASNPSDKMAAMQSKTSFKKFFQYAIAASLFLIVGVFEYQVEHEATISKELSENLSIREFEDEKNAVKGGNDNNCPNEETLNFYYKGEYQTFLAKLSKQVESSCNTYYTGLCLLRLNKIDDAIKSLEKVKKSTASDDTYLREAAEWNLCLAFLKKNEKQKTINELDKIIKTSDHNFEIKARELSDSLKKSYIFYNLRF
jgi:tetratricopeptide (TPR) repeat protein